MRRGAEVRFKVEEIFIMVGSMATALVPERRLQIKFSNLIRIQTFI